MVEVAAPAAEVVMQVATELHAAADVQLHSDCCGSSGGNDVVVVADDGGGCAGGDGDVDDDYDCCGHSEIDCSSSSSSQPHLPLSPASSLASSAYSRSSIMLAVACWLSTMGHSLSPSRP